jgi:hypothetical protein
MWNLLAEACERSQESFFYFFYLIGLLRLFIFFLLSLGTLSFRSLLFSVQLCREGCNGVVQVLFKCYFVDSIFQESMLQDRGVDAISIAELTLALACITVCYEFSGHKSDFSRFVC